jgi:acyl-lipid omega-6 desaturase (Delta-12 desaturase)
MSQTALAEPVELAEAPTATPRQWVDKLSPYRERSTGFAIFQAASTLLLHFACWAGMLAVYQRSWLAAVGLGILAGLFLVRLFIIQHDCGHGSFFASKTANDALGSFLGVLTLQPYYRWRMTHNMHHATSSDLAERRLDRDILTLTVAEYQASPWHKRLAYRAFRNVFFMLFLLAPFIFIVEARLAYDSYLRRREKLSTYGTSLALAGILVAGHFTVGLGTFCLLWLPVVMTGAGVGVWLFYVQHQFPDAYWAHKPEWTFVDAGLKGSSCYLVPQPLRYFTGNIGYHQIHHLDPRIPNYNLPRCYEDLPELKAAPHLTLLQSLRCVFANLYDEERGRMVSFREARQTAAQ